MWAFPTEICQSYWGGCTPSCAGLHQKQWRAHTWGMWQGMFALLQGSQGWFKYIISYCLINKLFITVFFSSSCWWNTRKNLYHRSLLKSFVISWVSWFACVVKCNEWPHAVSVFRSPWNYWASSRFHCWTSCFCSLKTSYCTVECKCVCICRTMYVSFC